MGQSTTIDDGAIMDGAIIELNQQANHAFYSRAEIQTWYGFRVLAVDGSKYYLPNNPDIHQVFGGQPNQYTEVY